MLPVAKKVALAIGVPHYNLLQNNGKIAHQVVPHTHFHIIPKPNAEEGLIMEWNAQKPSSDELKEEMSRIVDSL
ncbi:Adenosine 5'-monophosphoramidase [Entomophthora muscae]|uniref:Adenosine 5'-monophosphoramidase n=1 Tax=Entomophthora muscae TaxID=34485 RepID=A0ACC2TCR8_9FUNG|nr:Adenosine 5'-monophosphoramidase [Entomophthora muscae]